MKTGECGHSPTAKDPQMTKANQFWKFDCRVSGCKWALQTRDEKWMWRMAMRFCQGRRLRSWPDPLPVFAYGARYFKEFVDMPCSIDGIQIVSERLRLFLLKEAPGAAQFMPITLEGPRSSEIPFPYWIINWTKVFDCLDPQSFNVDDAGIRYVEVPIIDASRIPDDGVLGVLGEFEVVSLVRNDLRLKMIKAGFTGLEFFRIAHSDGTDFRPYMSVDWSQVPEDEGVRAAIARSKAKNAKGRKAARQTKPAKRRRAAKKKLADGKHKPSR